MARRVFDHAITIAPKLVSQRHDDLGPGAQGLLIQGIDILDIEMNRDGRGVERQWRHSTHLGEFVVEQNPRVADLKIGVQERLAIGRHASTKLLGTEGPFVELDHVHAPAHSEMRRDGVKTRGNALDGIVHVFVSGSVLDKNQTVPKHPTSRQRKSSCE